MERPLARTGALLLGAAVIVTVFPWFSLIAIITVLLPGLAVSGYLLPNSSHRVRTILGFGCGLCLIAIITYLTRVIPLPFIPLIAVNAAAGSAVLVHRYRDHRPADMHAPSWTTITIAGIATLGILSRVLPVISMQAPMFADPAVEGTIARLIVQHNGLPVTWEPFLPVALNHQPGYAGIVAALHVVSGIAIPRVVLLLTTTLYALLPLSVYVVGSALFDERRGVVAGFAALLFSFPAFTFVAGMNAANAGFFLVPLLIWTIINSCDRSDRRSLAGAALLGVGMLLIHPLPLLVAGVTGGTYLLVRFASNPSGITRYVKTGIAAFVVPLLISLPYYLQTIQQSSRQAVEAWQIQASYVNPDYELALWQAIEPFYTMFHNPYGIWYLDFGNISIGSLLANNPVANIGVLLAAISVYVILRRRDRNGSLVIAWYAIFLGLSTVQAVVQFRFPGWQFVYPSRMKFFMVLPVSLLLSCAALFPYNVRIRDVAVPVTVAALILVAPWSLANTYGYLHHFTEEPDVSDADREAIAYLERHADQDAVVLNMLAGTEAGAFVGGPGQWIPAYTGNPIIFPATSITGNVSHVRDRAAFMAAINARNHSRFQRLIDRYDVSYIFLSNHTMRTRHPYRQPSVATIRSLCMCEIVFSNEDAAVLNVTRH